MKPDILTLWEKPELYQRVLSMWDRADKRRRRFALRKGRRLPCPTFRPRQVAASPLTQEKLDKVYAHFLNEQMAQDNLHDKITQPIHY